MSICDSEQFMHPKDKQIKQAELRAGEMRPPQGQSLEEEVRDMQREQNCFTSGKRFGFVLEHMLYERMDNNLRVHIVVHVQNPIR